MSSLCLNYTEVFSVQITVVTSWRFVFSPALTELTYKMINKLSSSLDKLSFSRDYSINSIFVFVFV